MKTTSSKGWMAALVFSLAGCATVAPPQLVEARRVYRQSAEGPAPRVSPTELYEAKKALDRADAAFQEEGDTTEVRDLAYIATRRAQVADARARAAVDRQRIADAIKAGARVRDRQVKETQDALAATREQLAGERSRSEVVTAQVQRERELREAELEKATAALEAEREARMSAEGRLQAAMRDLATVAAVKEEARGVVITLSGSVLFPSGKSTLLETAKTRLDQVAEALKAQTSDRTIVVEGHTDSQGSDRINEPLSQRRAETVRDYLVTRGVDVDRISAVGMGARRPVVDNGTAENRANNRRVEIVISNPPVSLLQ